MTQYLDIRIEPPLDQWPDWIVVSEVDNSRLNQLRTSARKRLVQSAELYLLKLNSIAEDAGLEDESRSVLTGDPASQPIVMTGHQPVIFHSGLAFKYKTTEQVAAEVQGIGVSVTIDTDRGDSGQFTFPHQAIDSSAANPDGDWQSLPVSREVATIAKSHNLFVHGRLQEAAQIETTAREVISEFHGLSSDFSQSTAEAAFEAYEKLATAKCPSAEANTIVRSASGIGGRLLELPLSAIASFPESLTLTSDILKQSQRFASVYNSTLEMFRTERGIRNAANPFPALKIVGQKCELPFWVVDHENSVRHVLEVEQDGDITRLIANDRTIDTFTGSISADALEPMLLQNIQLVPRGALITAFLRLLFSDLFVHGIGGARYDQFTDEFVRNWWNCEAPAFTVATASRFVFPKQIQQLKRLSGLKENLRDMQFNPQKSFGENLFPASLESKLKELTDQKLQLVKQLKAAKSAGEPAGEFGQQLQEITEQIKSLISDYSRQDLELLDRVTPEQLDTINSRTYPWFFFDQSAG